ncbi:hypothetical protein E2C01_079068 [Portunus trituberculatus]|uniref:Uncharacterized protein n=1 Tax=Portunus trituberculatus TaxID=210409 RepID=A0A5B7IG08_PORTR|nr:hypothetical protein [Portunus trituberculatus]
MKRLPETFASLSAWLGQASREMQDVKASLTQKKGGASECKFVPGRSSLPNTAVKSIPCLTCKLVALLSWPVLTHLNVGPYEAVGYKQSQTDGEGSMVPSSGCMYARL